MTTVNKHFIDQIIAPFVGGADDDSEVARFRQLDMNDPAIARQVVKREVKPVFQALHPAVQECAKASLAYYLTTNRLDFQRIVDGDLFPFDVTDARGLFVIIWETLFPSEPYDKLGGQICTESHDPDDVFRMHLQIGSRNTEKGAMTKGTDLLPCACCGAKTIGARWQWEICQVCHWEDDPIQAENPACAGSNRMTLDEARTWWLETRKPLP